MEINGIPLHPLVVHGAVVLGPVAGVVAIVYAVLPSWRDRLRWPMVVLALLATAFIWAAFLTGENLRDDRFKGVTGELAGRIEDHEELAETLRIVTSVFGVIAIAAAALHRRTGMVRIATGVLLVASAAATLVYVVLTGDAGARAVWSS